jgi:hypothetical protein
LALYGLNAYDPLWILWDGSVNFMLLDERVLFPGPILGGLARLILSRRMPDVKVSGLLSRGAGDICLAVSKGGVSFQLGVRFNIDHRGIAFVKTMHRRIRLGDAFGTMRDDSRIFIEDEPDERIIMRSSRQAFRGFWETALKNEWDPGKAAAERRKINDAIVHGTYPDTFQALTPSGDITSVLPVRNITHQGTASAA